MSDVTAMILGGSLTLAGVCAGFGIALAIQWAHRDH